MAPPSRTPNLAVTPDPVQARLRREPHDFEFFQAVRLLEQLSAGTEPVGRFVPPANEVVRFSSHVSLSFPASQIQELIYRDGLPPLMIVNFLGLIGPSGVLPVYYTEFIQQRVALQDTSAHAFFDIFQHRLISLFYRAWQKYRFYTLHGQGALDRFHDHVLNLAGLGHPELRNRQAVPDDTMGFFTGLMTQQPRSAVSCERFLEDYFEVPVRIEQFVGAWYKLDAATQTHMDDDGSQSEILGMGAVVGDEIWEPQAGMLVVIGPLRLAQYRSFLPTGSAYRPLGQLIRFFAGDEFDFQLQLILAQDEVPDCELGVDDGDAPLLGWISWASSRPIERNPSDTILPL